MQPREILKQMEGTEHPAAKAFHYGDNFKVLIFGYKKGMKIKDHKTKHPIKLLVLEGDVIYTQKKETSASINIEKLIFLHA